jgi:hypothetical protein
MIAEMPQVSSPRVQLREAIAAVKIAELACTAAKQIADRGIADLNRATTALQPFESLDARMAQARIQALKAGKWEGYPAELRGQQLEKIHALEEAKHAKLASDQLDAELNDARDNLVIAERTLDEAAAAVFTEQVAEVVAKLDAVNREREYLRRVLRGAGVPFGGPGFERLMPVQREHIMADAVRGAKFPAGTLQGWREVNAAATTSLSQGHPPDNDVADATARAYWQRYASSILNDPEAQPDPLPDHASLLH